MPTLKTIGMGVGLISSVGGIFGAVSYSTGLFSSNTQITELIKRENKVLLLNLNSTQEEWKIPWETYKQSKKLWGDFSTTENQIPETFKNECIRRASNSVYGVEDQIYKEITRYCTRDKNIADLLREQSFNLLDTKGEEAEWKKRFDKYKETTNVLKLKDLEIQPSDNKETHYTKLRDGCQKALEIKIKESNYSKNIPAIKEWCKSKK